MIKKGIIILSLSVTFTPVWADNPSVNPRPRMQSMGGAGSALSGDKDSAMINPAALSDVKDWEIQAFPLLLEVPFETKVLTSFMDFNDVRDNAGSTTAQKQAALESFLREVASTAAATRVNLYPSWTMKNFHIGLLADFYVNPRMRVGGAPANQLVDLGGSAGTAGLIVGGSYGFFEDTLSVGLTVKPLYRIALTAYDEQTLYDVLSGQDNNATTPSAADNLLGADKGGQRAFGVGADLGVRYKFKWYGEADSGFKTFIEEWNPSVALTYQDIGNTRFFTDTALPQDIEQSISAGFALEKKFLFTTNRFVLDFRNIQQEQEFMNKLHFGLESVLWDILAFRAGLTQGYVGGGIGLDLHYFQMEAYCTAEEAGEYAHIQEQRVLGLRLSAAF